MPASIKPLRRQTSHTTAVHTRCRIEPLERRRLLSAPALAWSSYLGGTAYEYGEAVAIDGSGNAWVTGYTGSSDVAVGGFDTSFNGGYDAFVAKIHADGTPAWISYLGGASDDRGIGIAIDGSGNAWVTGYTASPDFAVGGFDTSYNGGYDTFVAKINANGTLAWSSYLGGGAGTAHDYGGAITIDGSGNAWVTGITAFSGWAVGGFDTSYNGGTYDAYVAKINADGTLAWSSYLGGTGSEGGILLNGDRGRGIAIDSAGNAWLTGVTASSGWTVGGFDRSYNGGDPQFGGDAFVAKINANGTLAWSSYLGGSSDDYGYDLALDGSGNAWVTGRTFSSHWAAGGFDTKYNGGDGDAFIAKIKANGTLAWTSYLGGSGIDFGSDIAMDSSGNAWVAGSTYAGGWAAGGFDSSYNGGNAEAFIAKINANGTLNSSSYLGGATGATGYGLELGYGIAVDGSGNAWMTGLTQPSASDWTVGGFDTSYNGGSGDVFIAKVNNTALARPAQAAAFSGTLIATGHEDWGDSSPMDLLFGNDEQLLILALQGSSPLA